MLLKCIFFIMIAIFLAEASAQVCLNEDVENPKDIAACTRGDGGQFMCPIDSVICEKVVPDDVSSKENNDVKYTCPLGNQYPCTKSGNDFQCSSNICFDPHQESQKMTDDIGGTMLTNSGAMNRAGECLGQVYIFNGRAQKCRTKGFHTAFKDCCAKKGKVLKDGSGIPTLSATQGISGVYQAGSAAYTAYAAGQTASQVSSIFGNALVGAFDPTTLALSLSVALITEYMMNKCDQMEVETAMSNGSDRCVSLGTYCKEKWLGFCVQKQKSFCCFNSELATIIQKHGRLQLKAFKDLPNGGFGDMKNPQCRGFTPEEFQALDFSNIDLSAYYAELLSDNQTELQKTMIEQTEEHIKNVS